MDAHRSRKPTNQKETWCIWSTLIIKSACCSFAIYTVRQKVKPVGSSFVNHWGKQSWVSKDYIHPVQPPLQQHGRLITSSGQCNNASFMGVIHLCYFMIYSKGGGEVWLLTPNLNLVLLYLNLFGDHSGRTKGCWCCILCPITASSLALPRDSHFRGWMPYPGIVAFPCVQVRNPCWGLQRIWILLAGWTGAGGCYDNSTQMLKVIGRIANLHGYAKLCYDARQEQHDKCLNVAVSAFVLIPEC